MSQEDVEEAIRLIHASKASLVEDSRGAGSGGGGAGGMGTSAEDTVSAIYAIMRDHAIQTRSGNISYMQVGLALSHFPYRARLWGLWNGIRWSP